VDINVPELVTQNKILVTITTNVRKCASKTKLAAKRATNAARNVTKSVILVGLKKFDCFNVVITY